MILEFIHPNVTTVLSVLCMCIILPFMVHFDRKGRNGKANVCQGCFDDVMFNHQNRSLQHDSKETIGQRSSLLSLEGNFSFRTQRVESDKNERKRNDWVGQKDTKSRARKETEQENAIKGTFMQQRE